MDIDINVYQTAKLLEQTGKNLQDIKPGQMFLELTPKGWFIKIKSAKLDFLNINTLCSAKNLARRILTETRSIASRTIKGPSLQVDRDCHLGPFPNNQLWLSLSHCHLAPIFHFCLYGYLGIHLVQCWSPHTIV